MFSIFTHFFAINTRLLTRVTHYSRKTPVCHNITRLRAIIHCLFAIISRLSHPSGRNIARLVARLTPPVFRVIAVLLGVREEQVTAEHRSSLLSFPQWVHLEAR